MNGFGPKVFAWFKGLERDNTREYFNATRDFYEDKVRDALEDLLHEIGGDDVKVFRQHRDLRFTKDKSPYKTRTYGIAGRLYVALSAEGLYAGTGYYRMEREQLERYRESIDEDLAEAVAGAERAGMEIRGDQLKTAPRGYPRDHPQIDLLRRKQLIVGKQLPAGKGISGERALAHARGVWDAAEPIVAWLDDRVGR